MSAGVGFLGLVGVEGLGSVLAGGACKGFRGRAGARLWAWDTGVFWVVLGPGRRV